VRVLVGSAPVVLYVAFTAPVQSWGRFLWRRGQSEANMYRIEDNADDNDDYGNRDYGRPCAVSAPILPTKPIFVRWALFIRHCCTVTKSFSPETLLAFGA
jgi:hypothetical protein